MNRSKINKLPIVVIAIAVLIGLFSYITYNSYQHKNDTATADEIEQKETSGSQMKEEAIPTSAKEDSEINNSIINGSWLSECTEDGRFLEFSVKYPEVTNYDGMKGKIERMDNYRFQYKITFEGDGGIFYISSFDGDKALVWYCDEGTEYKDSLELNRTEKDTEPETAVVDAPAETNTANTNNTTSSSSSNTNTASNSSGSTNNSNNSNNNSTNKPSGHYETQTVLVKEAWDEQVETGCTQVCVQEAYDTTEMVYLEGAYYGADRQEIMVCNQCGAEFWNGGAADHIANSDGCGGYHNEFRDISEPYWHNVDYRTVHHDAVYETRCTYETVHHDAEYKEVQVWVED